MSETTPPWRPWFRLSHLLWLMLCIALAIGMYRYGYHAGHEDFLHQRMFVGNVRPRVYYVSDVVTAKPTGGGGVVIDFDQLRGDLQREVLPNTWDEMGGAATMAEFPTNISVVIAHDEDGHERIAAWMQRRREQMLQSGMPTISSLSGKNPPNSK